MLLAAGAGGYVAARETSVFAVTAIDVRGANQQLSRDVRTALAPLEGMSLVEIDATEIDRRAGALPWVAGIRYDRAFPHTLRVWVEPQVPVAVLRRGGDSWLASARGRVLEQVDRGLWPRFPRVWLPAAAAPRVGADVPNAAAPAVTALAPAAHLPFLGRVRSVRLEEGAVTLVLRSGVEVRLGEPRDVPLKIEIARRLLDGVVAPGYVDLSVPERPVIGGNPQVEG